MKRLTYLAVVLTLAIFQTIANGQTISPLNNECSSKKCDSRFTVTNNGRKPMTVTVTPLSFTLDSSGSATFRPLDSSVTVDLSTLSARISPQQTFVFDYTIRCQQAPCMVDFAAAMMTGHVTSGVGLRIILNHIVYACSEIKNCRLNTLKSVGYVPQP